MSDDLIDLSDEKLNNSKPRKARKKNMENEKEEENIDFLDNLLAYDFESHLKDS